MGRRGLSSWAFVRLLLLGCWALTVLHLLLNPWAWPGTTGDPREPPLSYTILTIHQGYQAPQVLARQRLRSRLSASQHYQDEREQLAHSQKLPRPLDLQPWADLSESFQSEAYRFLNYIGTLQLHCSVALSQALQRGRLDGVEGAWEVCLDHMTTLSPKQEKCLVYTFSVVKRATDFEEKMSNVGCEVHTFGLTPQKEDNLRQKNHQVVHHPRLWLDWREHRLIALPQGQKSSSRKLRQILQELGHAKTE
uniref:Methyltransferase-like protein 24 isoform X2 n=1 Tax=Geotrypetes seraphini TaxID=260995 RepID=A0A6P8RWC7_GEOSA|nr:methyltransferase-like protein 24 isoform X2 [Geotrypetes seraphini]